MGVSDYPFKTCSLSGTNVQVGTNALGQHCQWVWCHTHKRYHSFPLDGILSTGTGKTSLEEGKMKNGHGFVVVNRDQMEYDTEEEAIAYAKDNVVQYKQPMYVAKVTVKIAPTAQVDITRMDEAKRK